MARGFQSFLGNPQKGFDDDDDNGGGREGKLAWFGTDEAYRNPSVLGEVVLN